MNFEIDPQSTILWNRVLSDLTFKEWMTEVAFKLSQNPTVIDLRERTRGSIHLVTGVLINLSESRLSYEEGRSFWLSPVLGDSDDYFFRNPFLRCTVKEEERLCMSSSGRGIAIGSIRMNILHRVDSVSIEKLVRGEVFTSVSEDDDEIEHCMYMTTDEFITEVLGDQRYYRTKSARS